MSALLDDSIVIVLAGNQAEIAASLERESVSVNLGASKNNTTDRIANALHSLLNDLDRRQRMSRNGCKLVDGLGVVRVTGLLSGRGFNLSMDSDRVSSTA